MTPDLRIQQAIALADARGVKIVGSTPEFDTAEAERIATLFGIRPPGVRCQLAHFACPFGKAHVAVVRAEDRPGSGDVIGFRFLLLSRDLYRHLGDPFAISDRYPVNWNATGTLPELAWPVEVLPERTIEQLDGILKVGDGPLLLGAAQAIVDGNRVVIRRDAPEERLIRDLWQLLPDKTRAECWPASFAFSDELGLHLVAGPVQVASAVASKPLTEEAVRDYPSSNYELNLQIAIESGDRAALRRLLARRTLDDSIRLTIYIVIFSLIVAVLFRFVL
ncbi:MAG: hypothetical protein C0467_07535 [Planctomycetaceae bacterium]|nr:hypothetical protein [Planctomycetaceae bacterium]